jgi:hypothetical protein
VLSARDLVGSHDIVLVTLDTLRHDVAVRCHEAGGLPVLGPHLGAGWEERHSPGSFTYAAHAAFFAGFLPTPARPGTHERLFALAFPGSETTGSRTAVLHGGDIVEGLRHEGYRSICIGGTGFFNQLTPLGCKLPDLFDVARWDRSLGVTDPDSTRHQVAAALQELPDDPAQRVLLFLNVSALHQPNCGYLAGAVADGPETMEAALRYVDAQLAPLLAAMSRRGPSLWIVCSDHGTAYGEDGYTGHRVGLPVVYTVPYAEFVLPESP